MVSTRREEHSGATPRAMGGRAVFRAGLLPTTVVLVTAACAGDAVDESWTLAVDTLPGGGLHMVNTPPAEGPPR